MKKPSKITVLSAMLLGTGSLLLAFIPPVSLVLLPARVSASSAPAPTPAPVVTRPVMAVKPPEILVQNNASVLDERRQLALGMIETGNKDQLVGGAGEVSRYQIMPVVWHQFTGSSNYRDPAVSQAVARQLWATLYTQFKRNAHREPTDFDMYVLWNTRYDYYARRGFNPARLGPTIRDRAQRFVNLVEHAEF